MVTLADRQYTLENFYSFVEACGKTDRPLPEETYKQITFLAAKVGAPTYSRTPNFKRVRKDRKYKCTPENWEAMRNFKATTIIKETEGVGKLIDDIILLLNKITRANYDDMSAAIVQIMVEVKSSEHTEGDLLKLGEAIFNIGSSNEFYSKLYASLYHDLIKSFPFMKDICLKNFTSFLELFANIENGDPEKDYDNFCRINKENAKRRAIAQFFVNLMLNDIIATDSMIIFVLNLLEKHRTFMKKEGVKSIVDEISENLFILVTSGKTYLSGVEAWDSIIDYTKEIAALKASTYPSLSNKTIFKCMDILEMI